MNLFYVYLVFQREDGYMGSGDYRRGFQTFCTLCHYSDRLHGFSDTISLL